MSKTNNDRLKCDCGYKAKKAEQLNKHQSTLRHGPYHVESKWKGDRVITGKKKKK